MPSCCFGVSTAFVTGCSARILFNVVRFETKNVVAVMELLGVVNQVKQSEKWNVYSEVVQSRVGKHEMILT